LAYFAKIFMLPEISGIIVIDKPDGITSAKVVARVKKLLNARKAGHAGTLDPFATGVTVCCINQATKLAQFFLHSSKKYEAVLFLGTETDTQDLTGKVVSRCEIQPSAFSEEKIYSVFQQFKGEILQAPPVYSALKHKGVPLYRLARKGNPVQKPARTVFISSLDILHINLPEIHFEVSCSGGTYIRTLCADIGTALGCGGHLKKLRRTESSGFNIKDAVKLSELESSPDLSGNLYDRIIPMADALHNMPVFIADNGLIKKIIYGQSITETDFTTDMPDGFIKVIDISSNLLAVLNKEGKSYNYCCVFQTSSF